MKASIQTNQKGKDGVMGLWMLIYYILDNPQEGIRTIGIYSPAFRLGRKASASFNSADSGWHSCRTASQSAGVSGRHQRPDAGVERKAGSAGPVSRCPVPRRQSGPWTNAVRNDGSPADPPSGVRGQRTMSPEGIGAAR